MQLQTEPKIPVCSIRGATCNNDIRGRWHLESSRPCSRANLVKTCNRTRLVENDEECENQERQKTHNASYRVQFAPSAEQLGCLLRISIERRIQ